MPQSWWTCQSSWSILETAKSYQNIQKRPLYTYIIMWKHHTFRISSGSRLEDIEKWCQFDGKSERENQ